MSEPDLAETIILPSRAGHVTLAERVEEQVDRAIKERVERLVNRKVATDCWGELTSLSVKIDDAAWRVTHEVPYPPGFRCPTCRSPPTWGYYRLGLDGASFDLCGICLYGFVGGRGHGRPVRRYWRRVGGPAQRIEAVKPLLLRLRTWLYLRRAYRETPGQGHVVFSAVEGLARRLLRTGRISPEEVEWFSSIYHGAEDGAVEGHSEHLGHLLASPGSDQGLVALRTLCRPEIFSVLPQRDADRIDRCVARLIDGRALRAAEVSWMASLARGHARDAKGRLIALRSVARERPIPIGRGIHLKLDRDGKIMDLDKIRPGVPFR